MQTQSITRNTNEKTSATASEASPWSSSLLERTISKMPTGSKILVYPAGRNARLAVEDLLSTCKLNGKTFLGYADDNPSADHDDVSSLDQAVERHNPTHVLVCARSTQLEAALVSNVRSRFPNLTIAVPRHDLVEALATGGTNGRRPRSLEDIKNISIVMCKTCNIRCSFCYQTDFTQRMEPSAFTDKLDPVYKKAELLRLVGGEVTAYPQARSFAETISRKYPNLKLGMTTNGTLFDERWANVFCETGGNVLVSIGAGTRESYKHVTGKDYYEQVVDNLSRIVQMRNDRNSQLDLFLSMVITPQTQQDIQKVIDLGASVGVDRVSMGVDAMTMNQLDRSLIERQVRDVLSSNTVPVVWDRLGMLYPDLIEDVSITQPCTAASDSVFVEVNQDVFVCCHSHVAIGSLTQNDIETIWCSRPGYAVESDVFSGQCATCPQDCIYRPATARDKPEAP